MRILIISSQSNFVEQVQAACLVYKNLGISIRTSESMGLGLELAEQFEAQLVFIDLTKNVEAGILAVEELARISNRMVAVSIDKLNTEFATRTIRAGAREILSQPIQSEDVNEIIAKTEHSLNKNATSQPARNGKIIICFSSKGGVGKTTLACNLAITLEQRFGEGKVALIDANTQAPNVSAMLNLKPNRWLRDAVLEYKRLDSQLLSDLMTVHEPSGLKVLAHSSENPLGLDFSEDQLSKILLVSKGTFEWTIVDSFPLLSSLNLSMMDLSDQVLLVTEAVVPALRSTRYNLEMLKKAGYGEERIRVVLNRFTRFTGNVTPELVQETLAWPLNSVVPYDVHSTIAANSGQALVQMFPDRDVSLAIADLADAITGVETPALPPETWLEKNMRNFRNWLDNS